MQLAVFQDRARGVFKEARTWEDAKNMPGHEWWALYGSELPELQFVALRVLSKRSSACSVERLWSLFKLVWTDSRARLGPKKAIDLVKAGSNLRLKHKLDVIKYESEMRSWLVEPAESDDEEDSEEEEEENDGEEDDGARAAGAGAAAAMNMVE